MPVFLKTIRKKNNQKTTTQKNNILLYCVRFNRFTQICLNVIQLLFSVGEQQEDIYPPDVTVMAITIKKKKANCHYA